MKSKTCILLTLAFISCPLFPQEWKTPEQEKVSISIRMFDEDMESEGRIIYNRLCSSCHGTPTQGNFTLMVPPPGDISTKRFQDQTDGELFYKIRTGKGSMPKFGDALGQDEIWSLVAFIRSFNEDYVQPEPDLEGIKIPDIRLKLSFDDNVDKLVVKTYDENGDPMFDVAVKAFVKGSFGNFLLGNDTCNELGIAYFDVPPDLPGDKNGVLNFIAKASKGYGYAKAMQTIVVTSPRNFEPLTKGRHLWSVGKKAPYWLIITFITAVAGIWGTIIYVISGLLKLKNHS